MNKQVKRLPIYIISALIAIFLIVWTISLIKCEVLTNKYYEDFKSAYQGNTMLEETEYFKVLKCNGKTAEVYYVSKGNTSGDVLEFQMHNGAWVETNWRTIWSKSGSASGAVWPYWWQFFVTGF